MAGCVLHFLTQITQREMALLESVAFGETQDQGTQAGLCKMLYQPFTAPVGEVSMGHAPVTHHLSCANAKDSRLYHDSSSSPEESKKQSFLFFKDTLPFSYAQTAPLPGFFLLSEFSVPALQFIHIMLRSLFLCTHS